MRSRVSDPADFGCVAVLMGGWSDEREVSLWSGKNVLEALLVRGVDAHAVDVTRRNVLSLGEAGFTRAFNVLHGVGGEDGTVQAALELQNIAYPGCGVLASALSMDKLLCKRIWRAEGLPTPDYSVLSVSGDACAAAGNLEYPLIVKPVADGSSLGVSKVTAPEQLAVAFRKARGTGTDRAVMAEAFVVGEEYTCAILDDEALPLIWIEPDGDFYDYRAKYLSNATRYHCPAPLDARLSATLQALCCRAFQMLGGEGWGRVDFILDAEKTPWLIEVNTLPGMTAHSLVPMAAMAAGLAFTDLCWAVLETSFVYRGTKEGPQ